MIWPLLFALIAGRHGAHDGQGRGGPETSPGGMGRPGATTPVARSVAGTPAWLSRALEHAEGPAWRGMAELLTPLGLDTVQVCRDSRGERLDFPGGRAHLQTGREEMLFLPRRRTALVWPKHARRPPPGVSIRVIGPDTAAGRPVMVAELALPGGRGRRLWVDTVLSTVLRGQRLGRAGGGPERRFLTLRVGEGCPGEAFAVPAGYKIVRRDEAPWSRHGRFRGERAGDDDGAAQAERRRVPGRARLRQALGFLPPQPRWLPSGWVYQEWALVELPEGPAAQLVVRGPGASVSLFAHRDGFGSPCGSEAFCSLDGDDNFLRVRAGDLVVDLLGPQDRSILERIGASLAP